jgi:hypothetical protein
MKIAKRKMLELIPRGHFFGTQIRKTHTLTLEEKLKEGAI